MYLNFCCAVYKKESGFSDGIVGQQWKLRDNIEKFDKRKIGMGHFSIQQFDILLSKMTIRNSSENRPVQIFHFVIPIFLHIPVHLLPSYDPLRG